MPQGFQSYSSDGRVVFDSETMMFGMVGKGSATVTQSNVSQDSVGVIFVNNLPAHQFAVLSCNYPIDLEIANSGLNPKTNVNVFVKAPNGASTTLNYWLFTYYAGLADSSAGIIAYNSSGQKCLDLGYPPLRVIDSAPVSITSTNMNQFVGVSGTENRTLGYLRYGTVERRTGEQIGTVGDSGSGPGVFYREFIAVKAESGGFSVTTRAGATRSNTPGNVSSGGVLTCDMTNF